MNHNNLCRAQPGRGSGAQRYVGPHYLDLSPGDVNQQKEPDREAGLADFLGEILFQGPFSPCFRDNNPWQGLFPNCCSVRPPRAPFVPKERAKSSGPWVSQLLVIHSQPVSPFLCLFCCNLAPEPDTNITARPEILTRAEIISGVRFFICMVW